MCSAIAATGVPALVMAKGHVIDGIPEVGLPGAINYCVFLFHVPDHEAN